MKCIHENFVHTRDGKECAKCFLTWRLALKEKRQAKREKIRYQSRIALAQMDGAIAVVNRSRHGYPIRLWVMPEQYKPESWDTQQSWDDVTKHTEEELHHSILDYLNSYDAIIPLLQKQKWPILKLVDRILGERSEQGAVLDFYLSTPEQIGIAILKAHAMIQQEQRKQPKPYTTADFVGEHSVVIDAILKESLHQ